MQGANKLKRFTDAAGDQPTVATARLPQDLRVLGYLRCDADGLIVTVNATLVAWLGLREGESPIGRKLTSILSEESLWRQWMSQRKPVTCRVDLTCKDGSHLPVKAEVRSADAPAGLEVWMIEDFASEMIARVARLEASRTLTAGTVHDVNNVLTVLSGNLFLLTESARDQPKLYEQARRARNAASRGSTLLRELLTFNREPDGEAKAIRPGNHVLALKPLLLRTVRANGCDHELKLTVDRTAGSVVSSAAQFESAVINLVLNARDALKPCGKVHIRVCNVKLGADPAEELGVIAGDYVCVAVIDNGAGIPKKYLSRVTEPLFSTKPKDRGSGLGLSMVRHFVESGRGALSIDSVEGRGTRVRLWLPRTETLAETTANMTLPLSTLPGGDALLLLLSRDFDVRSSMQQILETLGYTVLVAESFEDVDRVLAGPAEPALLIGERSADALRTERRWIDAIRDAHPNVRHLALLQAGVSVNEAAPDADGHVYRPVSVPELAQTVRNVLEKS
ncbi:MAG: ATP-binding protein [Woeseia sp.]